MMNPDSQVSVPALEDRKREELSTEYRDKFVRRMYRLRSLKKTFKEDCSFNGIHSDKHLMFKYICDDEGRTELWSKDGNRAYEFLIEFDLVDTAYGIYYGCRGLIKGGDQEEQIARLQAEWDEVLRGEVCNVLNNTFVDKDFSGRFQKTNNANDRTYWPFWVSLFEEEDVIDVAARAVQLMYRIYKRYLVDGIVPENRVVTPKALEVRTRYTRAAFDASMAAIEADLQKLDEATKAKALLQRFLKNATREGRAGRKGLVVDTRYEKCWRFHGISNVQSAFLLAELSKRMGVLKEMAREKGKDTAKVPWGFFSAYLLSESDKPLESIRQLYKQGKDTSLVHEKWARQYLDRISIY